MTPDAIAITSLLAVMLGIAGCIAIMWPSIRSAHIDARLWWHQRRNRRP